MTKILFLIIHYGFTQPLISPEVFGVQKSNGIRWICYVLSFNLICNTFLQLKWFGFQRSKHKTLTILKSVKISFRGKQKFRSCSLSTAISLKVFTLGKRDSTFQNCQTKMFNLICVPFRSNKNYRSYKPKRKVTGFFCTPFNTMNCRIAQTVGNFQ